MNNPEQPQLLDWFGNPLPVPAPVTKPEEGVNPCLALYGPGPAEQTCKTCTYLAGICYSKTVYKCRLRKNTHGKSTDHHVRWPACAKFEQRTEDIPLYDGR